MLGKCGACADFSDVTEFISVLRKRNTRGVVEALEKDSEQRKRKLELAKTTPEKKRRITLKRKRVKEGIERIKWSKEHGHLAYFGGREVEDKVCDTSDGVNQKKEKGSARGKGKPRDKRKCAACGSTTHLCSSHGDCPFYKGHANKESHSDNSVGKLLIPD